MAIAFYSSGPMEPGITGLASGIAKVVNLNSVSVDVRVRVFDLNGTRALSDERLFSVGPLASNFTALTVAENIGNYEITISLDTPGNVDRVLISYWGRDSGSNIIPSQRLVHEEFHRLLS